jgi:hypothetical protein
MPLKYPGEYLGGDIGLWSSGMRLPLLDPVEYR